MIFKTKRSSIVWKIELVQIWGLAGLGPPAEAGSPQITELRQEFSESTTFLGKMIEIQTYLQDSMDPDLPFLR